MNEDGVTIITETKEIITRHLKKYKILEPLTKIMIVFCVEVRPQFVDWNGTMHF